MKWLCLASIVLITLAEVLAATAPSTSHTIPTPERRALSLEAIRPMKITCLTIGSRGDVQPFIALGLGLQQDGHTVTIATHLEFKSMIEEAGIGFKNIGGDPKELIKHCVEYGFFSPAFYIKGYSKFSGWINELLTMSKEACEGAELLIESPTAMMGIHIAESMKIPYFRAFTMPWTPTKQYPQAFATTSRDYGKLYNKLSYLAFDYLFWKGIAPQVNRWRVKTLNLKPASFIKLHFSKIPFLYNFSDKIVKKPSDWGSKIHITGYWFQDQQANTDLKKIEESIPEDLRSFLQNAKADNKKVIYIGFGSVIFPDAARIQQNLAQALEEADVRAVISGGWSELKSVQSETIHSVGAVPHEWLFKNVDATLTHGGAGTTAASLRAGIPTLIKPFFGDQFFWAKSVERMGVGSHVNNFEVSELKSAFVRATTDSEQIAKAKEIGEVIRKENGVRTAIEKIYQDLDYARDLIKKGFQADRRPNSRFKPNDLVDQIESLAKGHRTTIYHTLMGIVRWLQISSIMKQNQEGLTDVGPLRPEKQSNSSLSSTPPTRLWISQTSRRK